MSRFYVPGYGYHECTQAELKALDDAVNAANEKSKKGAPRQSWQSMAPKHFGLKIKKGSD